MFLFTALGRSPSRLTVNVLAVTAKLTVKRIELLTNVLYAPLKSSKSLLRKFAIIKPLMRYSS